MWPVQVGEPQTGTMMTMVTQGYSGAGAEILNQSNLNTKLRKWFMSLHKTEQLIFTLVMWTVVEGEEQTKTTKLNNGSYLW